MAIFLLRDTVIKLQRIGKGDRMGGRGSRSGGLGAGGGLGAVGGGAGGALFGTPAAATPPQVTPGQPVPAISIQQLQSMSDQEFAAYMNGLKSTPIDRNTYYNSNWDTQRLVANMPELNRAPQVVDPQTFAGLSGPTIYRTVNANARESAVDICGRTMMSDVTTIGEGRMGDGFYFHARLSSSQGFYGNTSNNIQKTATMSAKLNANARVISESQLQSMLSRESSSVRNAVRGMSSGGQWGGSGYMAYALHKGYNVVSDGTIYNVIDRNAATFSNNVIPKS